MRLFISYARVDKPYCKQIVELLDMHTVWYDQRLHIGQKWWDQIVWRLNWCDGMIYLLSPDSIASDYCRNEFTIAATNNKKIFPVLIHAGTKIPPDLAQYQYADFTNGLDVSAVKSLLSSLIIAERQLKDASPIISEPAIVGQTSPTPMIPIPTVASPSGTPMPISAPATTSSAPLPLPGSHPPSMPPITPPSVTPQPSVSGDGSTILDEAVSAFKACDFDKAVRLLKQVLQSGYTSRFIDIPTMLKQAEVGLSRQAYEREAQREYAPIANLMKDEATRALGCTAFQAFHATFPDYDPDNLREIYEQTIKKQPPFDVHKAMPLLEWCHISAGKIMGDGVRIKKATAIKEFFMSKYPVTNTQFQAFVTATDGYENPAWWQSSLEVRQWHADHPRPIEMPDNRENHPRTNICWYEAHAFCEWLSYKTGWTVKLPTAQQWQRAAQGDTNWHYPWSSKFEPDYCNTKESEVRGTTPVTQYPKSASPFGVCDMLGNVWEWCANGQAAVDESSNGDKADLLRVVRGGSFMSLRKRTSIEFHYVLNPLYRYESIGFRLACETGAEFLGV